MGDVPETTDYKLLQRKLAREMAARAEAEALLESRSRELYASNLALSDANRQLTVAREDSEEASKAKSLFIGNMSHELLTPMNSIIGLSQLLLDTPLDDKQRHFLQSISSSAQVLLSMLKDVMQISAIDSGRLALHPRWFRVDELIEEAAAQIHAAARAKGLEIILSHVDILHTKILADRERLVQALQILLSNAVKFTEQGYVQVSGEIQVHPAHGPLLKFTVSDTGIGMTTQEQARIFQPFEQVDQSVSKLYGGVGLGLSILRQLAGLMGGEVLLESAIGSGSTFVFSIPVETVKAAAEEADAVGQQESGLERMPVLIVDRTPKALEAQVALLSRYGCKLAIAGTAKQAQQILLEAESNALSFAAVMIDWQTDDATALTQWIRQRWPNARPTVIGLTTMSRQELQLEAEQAGCDVLLEKPLTSQVITTELIRLLGMPLPSAGQLPTWSQPAVVASELDLARLRAWLDDGNVNVLEWVDENEQALRRQLAGDFFQFLSAVKKYDFGSAAPLLGPQLELPAGERS